MYHRSHAPRKLLRNGFTTVMFLSAVLLNAQIVDVAVWSGNKAGAISLTFDDGLSGHWSHAAPIMAASGVRGTFFVITGTVDWNGARNAALSGHEIGSHSTTDATFNNDANAAAKMQLSHAAIETEIGSIIQGSRCHSIAWPYGFRRLDVVNHPDYHGLYVAARGAGNALLANNSYNSGNTSLWWKHGEGTYGLDHYFVIGDALMTSGTTLETFNAQLDLVESRGAWTVFTYHGIETGGYQNISAAAFGAQVAAVAARMESSLWVAPFGDVVRYIRQRDAAEVAVVSNTGQRIEIVISDDLPNDRFNLPLTLTLAIPSGWTGVSAQQNGTSIPAHLDAGLLVFEAVPDAGTVVLENPVSEPLIPQVNLRKLPTDQLEMSWASESDVHYKILWSDNLTTWSPLEPVIELIGNGEIITRAVDMEDSPVWFRLEIRR